MGTAFRRVQATVMLRTRCHMLPVLQLFAFRVSYYLPHVCRLWGLCFGCLESKQAPIR